MTSKIGLTLLLCGLVGVFCALKRLESPEWKRVLIGAIGCCHIGAALMVAKAMSGSSVGYFLDVVLTGVGIFFFLSASRPARS